MSVAAISFRTPVLAWSVSPADEARYRRIKNTVLIVCALAVILLPAGAGRESSSAAAPVRSRGSGA